jgi:hypothetical protein
LSWLALAGTSTALDIPGTVSFAWDANPETDVAGYIVHYGSASGSLSQRLHVDTSPTATVSGLEPGNTYYFAVQAFNTAGLNSLLSSEVSVTIPVLDAPEISVRQASGNVLVSAQGTIHVGSASVGSPAATEVITISNVGTTALAGLSLSTTDQEFTVSSLSTTTLAPGASVNFGVTFTPSAAGSRSASVAIASNDSDENPFVIHFAGTGQTSPEIAIEQPGGINLIDGSANVHFSNSTLGSTGAPAIFTIRNNGNAALTGLATSVGGSASGDFVVSAPAITALAPGASTTFQVAFKPTVSGLRSATLHVASNDADENPFDVVLTGTGLAFPLLSVQQTDGSSLATGTKAPSFGGVAVGATSAARSYVVKNTGTAVLENLQITAAGSGVANFDLVTPAVTSLAPGASATFSIAFKPTSHGNKTTIVRVGGGNGSQSPVEITFEGDGVGIPEIAVIQETELASGGAALNYGSRDIGSSTPSKQFTIKNTGTGILSGLALASTGSGHADFIMSALGSTTLAPGESTLFEVSFKPIVQGSRSATLVLSSNDSDESSFTIHLGGNGVASPRISVVRASGKNLKDGAAFISFGTTALNSPSASQVLTIRNSGTATLSNLAIVKNGLHVSDFSVSALKVKSLAPGATASIKIQFRARSTGTRWGAIHISSNDTAIPSFDIVLTGVGRATTKIVKKVTKPAGIRSALLPTPAPAPIAGIEVIGGRKYRTLTVTQSAGNRLTPSDIEVSSNLVDWFSGRNHTTTLLNTSTTLKIRDNTPVTQERKRYIRLNPAATSE